VLAKGDVNGEDAQDFYVFLRESTSGKDIRWNFSSQFMVTPDGCVTRFDGKSPQDLVPDIEAALAALPAGRM
jgi:glutathione peroxidase-family protein